jgi:hypothetical protein
MNIEIFSPERKTGEALMLKKISRLVWEHHGSVKLYVSVTPRFKSLPIFIRMGDLTFRATWDDTGDVGVVNLTKTELKEITTGTGSVKGEHVTRCEINIVFIGIVCIFRSRTRSTNGNGRPSIQFETEV